MEPYQDEEILRLRDANRALLRERDHYQHIFAATTNLVLVADSTGRIYRLNPEAEHCFPAGGALGQFFWELLQLPASSLDEVLMTCRPESKQEIALFGGSLHYVLRILPSMPEGFILILNDITRQVDHAQELERLVLERTHALTNSETMLRHIFQSAGNGIMLVDEGLRIVKANHRACVIYGRSMEQLLGLDVRTLTDDEGRRVLESCLSEREDQGGRSDEMLALRSGGQVLPTSITVTRVAIDDKRFWTVIVRDISRQKALEERLRFEKKQTEEMNVTLRNVLKSIDAERRQFERNMADKIASELLPVLEKLDQESRGVRSGYLDLIRDQLIGLTRGFETELDANLLKLSRTEISVCRMIRAGSTTKEICEALNLAFETVQTHRKNIRRKLGLNGKSVNLQAFLASRSRSLLPAEA
ncbi:MAG: PAS domain S-box protein [Syntrophotaleaceae bacterium]